MSLEGSLAHCVLSTVEAGLACTVAGETGGLGAALCGTALSGAAIDCYEAGKDTIGWYEQNHPDPVPDPPEPEAIEPGMCVDPAANSDASWNSFYAAGAIYLTRNASPARLNRLGFRGHLLAAIHADSRIRLTANTAPPNLAEARDSLVQLCVDWGSWIAAVENLRFATLDHAQIFARAVNDGKRFALMAETFRAMKVGLPQ